jgi:signal transduction histidine kinase
VRDRAIGVVAVHDKHGREQRFSDGDQRLAEIFAARAAVAVDLSERVARDTVRRVIEGQELERRRLARELHDETGQALVSVLMGLRLVEQETEGAAEAMIGDLRDTVTTAIQELRALAVELRPTALDDFGLGPALERLVETFGRRTGINVDLDVSRLDAARLDERVETALYRIVQEALTNIAKHAGATNASVVAGRSADTMRLVVEDDGGGFDPEAAGGGLGLVSMRERAELVGGELALESSPAGTTVTAVVPVLARS